MPSYTVRTVFVAVLVAALTTPVGAGQLKFTFENGRVTILAQDVPVHEILAEWARVGQTTIVNAEKLVAPPVSLQLVEVPEGQALATLLRSASGYVAAPRGLAVSDASRFDRILILASSKPAPRAPAPFLPGANTPQPATPGRPGDNFQPDAGGVGLENPGGRPADTMFNYTNPNQVQQLQQLLEPGSDVPPQLPVFPRSPFEQPQPQTSPAPAPQTAPRPGVLVTPPPSSPSASGTPYPSGIVVPGTAPTRPQAADPPYPVTRRPPDE